MNAEIQRMGHEAGLKRRKQIAFNRAKKAQEMVSEGKSVRHIANYFGVDPSTITKDLKKDLTLLINNPELQ